LYHILNKYIVQVTQGTTRATQGSGKSRPQNWNFASNQGCRPTNTGHPAWRHSKGNEKHNVNILHPCFAVLVV